MKRNLVVAVVVVVVVTAGVVLVSGGENEAPNDQAKAEAKVERLIERACHRTEQVTCRRAAGDWSCSWRTSEGIERISFDDEPEGLYCSP